MLASLRSDRWTTSPEQLDGLTGIRTAQISRIKSPSHSATSSLSNFLRQRGIQTKSYASRLTVCASSSFDVANYCSRTHSRAPLRGAPNPDHLRQRTCAPAFPPNHKGWGFRAEDFMKL